MGEFSIGLGVKDGVSRNGRLEFRSELIMGDSSTLLASKDCEELPIEHSTPLVGDSSEMIDGVTCGLATGLL
jgi:hypothetical protein